VKDGRARAVADAGDARQVFRRAAVYRAVRRPRLTTRDCPCEARLASTEPGVDLSFRVERPGQVVGTYEFGGRGAYRPGLSGAFAMDQTYLGPSLAQVERLLADLAL
jgi:hypothetical protein